jgi:hypothetical protein
MASPYRAVTDEPTHGGEGITRTSDPRARFWPVSITFITSARPLRCTIKAVGARQAEQFARARHPHARTVVVGRPE